jgi:hypothetical protein
MPDPGLDTIRRIEPVPDVTQYAGGLRLLVSSVVVEVFVDHRCIVDVVEAMH